MSTTPEVDPKTAASVIDNDDESSLSDSSSSSDSEVDESTQAPEAASSAGTTDASQPKTKKGRQLQTPAARAEDKKTQAARASGGARRAGAARLAHRHRTHNKPLLKTLSRGVNAVLLRAGITRRSANVLNAFRVIGLTVCAEIMQGANVLTAHSGRKQVKSKDIAAACRYKLSEDMHVVE